MDRAEEAFAEELETRIRYFVQSGDKELELEPMNSYRRRLVHQIAKPYKLDSDSRGEDPKRYVCLIKSGKSEIPEGVAKPRAWDFGTITYPVDPGPDGLRLALLVDGSLEIWRERQSRMVLHERVVKARQVRIRNGKIVEPGETGW